MDVTAIIVCAGKSSRAKLGVNKILFDLGGKTVVQRAVEPFLQTEDVTEIIVCVSPVDEYAVKKIFTENPKIKVILGGETRTASVRNALTSASGEMVLIHDGARPFLTKKLICRVIEGVIKNGSGIAVVPSSDTLAVTEGKRILRTVRDGYYRVQTPQGFWTQDIRFAYSKISSDAVFTDDSAVYNAIITTPCVVEGEKENVKLTYPDDFKTPFRVGVGFDLHRLVAGRKLILGGVTVPHSTGLLGHSDADVLTHAIMDSLLSACSLKDIGYHFPDNDPQYKDVSSIELLKKVLEMIERKGYEVANVSACIMAEKPKLMPFVPEITENLASVMNISTDDLGITCTTLEGLGTVGREEGIAVSAYSLVRKKNE